MLFSVNDSDISEKSILIGLAILILLPLLVEASWVDFVGLAAIIVFAIIGFFFGQALDVREELRDLVKD